MIEVRINGNELKTILGNAMLAVERFPRKVLKVEMEQARDELRTYPPPRAGQTYVRTGKRYRATKVVAVGGTGYRLESNPLYNGRSANPYVLGTPQGGGQAWMHRRRWPKLIDVITRAIQRVKAKARDMFSERMLRGGPGGL